MLDRKIPTYFVHNIKQYSAEGQLPQNHFNKSDNLLIQGDLSKILHLLQFRFSNSISFLLMDPETLSEGENTSSNTENVPLPKLTRCFKKLAPLFMRDAYIWVKVQRDKHSEYVQALELVEEEFVFVQKVNQPLSEATLSSSYINDNDGEFWIFVYQPSTNGTELTINLTKFADKVSAPALDEQTLMQILQLSNLTEGIIMDMSGHSASLATVSHKLGKQYISVFTSEEFKDVGVKRLEHVIYGDQEGISSLAGWQGGGTFTYAEIFDIKDIIIDRISSIQEEEDLRSFISWAETTLPSSLSQPISSIITTPDYYERELTKEKIQLLIDVLDMHETNFTLKEIQKWVYEKSMIPFNHSYYCCDT